MMRSAATIRPMHYFRFIIEREYHAPASAIELFLTYYSRPAASDADNDEVPKLRMSANSTLDDFAARHYHIMPRLYITFIVCAALSYGLNYERKRALHLLLLTAIIL